MPSVPIIAGHVYLGLIVETGVAYLELIRVHTVEKHLGPYVFFD